MICERCGQNHEPDQPYTCMPPLPYPAPGTIALAAMEARIAAAYQERRRYALLQAAAELWNRNGWAAGEMAIDQGIPKMCVLCAKALLEEIEKDV